MKDFKIGDYVVVTQVVSGFGYDSSKRRRPFVTKCSRVGQLIGLKGLAIEHLKTPMP
jgi:hypothetical protein